MEELREILRGWQQQRVAVMMNCPQEHLNYEPEMVRPLGEERTRRMFGKHLPLVPQAAPGQVSEVAVLWLIHLSIIHGAQYGQCHLDQVPVLPFKTFSSLRASSHLIPLWNDRDRFVLHQHAQCQQFQCPRTLRGHSLRRSPQIPLELEFCSANTSYHTNHRIFHDVYNNLINGISSPLIPPLVPLDLVSVAFSDR